MIQIIGATRKECCFSEWMRTKNGQIAAVSCMALEKNNASLYAYAYVHSLLTFFRLYDTDCVITMKRKELSMSLLEFLKYAAQKLDVTLNQSEEHLLPNISAVVVLSDGNTVAFSFGSGAVEISDCKKHRVYTDCFLKRLWEKKRRISSKKLPLSALKMRKTVAYKEICLYPDVRFAKQSDSGGFLKLVQYDRPNEFAPQIYRAVITGRKHAAQGRYCQDNGNFRKLGNDDLAAALSDGAGGGNCSEYGALMNVNAFLSCCGGEIPLGKLKEHFLDRITEMHERLTLGKAEDAIQAYATFMGVYIRGEKAVCMHIGDGMIYGRKQDGTVECISDAENFHASNRTFFTIESDADEHLFLTELEKRDYEKILLMTDGVYNGFPDHTEKVESDGALRSTTANIVEAKNSPREEFIRRLFSQSDCDGFDDTVLAELIDTEEVLAYGDDHSAILIDLNNSAQMPDMIPDNTAQEDHN